MVSPCMDCLNRSLGCHGKCDLYAAYKDKRSEINQARYDALERDEIEVRNHIARNKKKLGSRYKRRQG